MSAHVCSLQRRRSEWGAAASRLSPLRRHAPQQRRYPEWRAAAFNPLLRRAPTDKHLVDADDLLWRARVLSVTLRFYGQHYSAQR